MKKERILIGAAIVLLIASTAYLVATQGMGTRTAERSGMQFEIARTPAELERGLSGRTHIPDNYGMLFVFETPDRYGIWMKDMLVPIDILWLADDGKILGIEARVDPGTYPNAFYAPVPVRYVLEVRAGYAEAMDWNVGNTIELPGGL